MYQYQFCYFFCPVNMCEIHWMLQLFPSYFLVTLIFYKFLFITDIVLFYISCKVLQLLQWLEKNWEVARLWSRPGGKLRDWGFHSGMSYQCITVLSRQRTGSRKTAVDAVCRKSPATPGWSISLINQAQIKLRKKACCSEFFLNVLTPNLSH